MEEILTRIMEALPLKDLIMKKTQELSTFANVLRWGSLVLVMAYFVLSLLEKANAIFKWW